MIHTKKSRILISQALFQSLLPHIARRFQSYIQSFSVSTVKTYNVALNRDSHPPITHHNATSQPPRPARLA